MGGCDRQVANVSRDVAKEVYPPSTRRTKLIVASDVEGADVLEHGGVLESAHQQLPQPAALMLWMHAERMQLPAVLVGPNAADPAHHVSVLNRSEAESLGVLEERVDFGGRGLDLTVRG